METLKNRVGRPQTVRKVMYLVKDANGNYSARQRGKPLHGQAYLAVEVRRTITPKTFVWGQTEIFNQYETTLEDIRNAKAAKGIKVNVVDNGSDVPFNVPVTEKTDTVAVPA